MHLEAPFYVVSALYVDASPREGAFAVGPSFTLSLKDMVSGLSSGQNPLFSTAFLDQVIVL